MRYLFNGLTQVYRRSWLRLLLVLATLLTVTLAFALPELNAHADNSSWPTTYLGDNGRSNFNSSETIINPSTAPNLQLLWQQVSCCEAPITSQPVVANNLLYWALWNGHAHGSQLLTGSNVWTHFLGLARHQSCDPRYAGVTDTSTVATVPINGQDTSVDFIGGGNGNFYALTASKGKIIWQTSLLRPGGHFIWGSSAVYNGSVYIGTATLADCIQAPGELYQLDASTGAIQNTFSVVPAGCTGGNIWGTMAIDEQTGILYFGTGSPGTCSQAEPYADSLVALNASDLSYVASWQVPSQKSGNDFRSTPTLFQGTINGVQYQMVGLLNDNGTYYTFDRTNIGAGTLWQDKLAAQQQGSYRYNTAASSWDGTTLYVAANTTVINGAQCASSVSAINPADGSFLWQDCLNIGPALWTTSVPGLVVFGAGATLNVADATNGNVLFTYTASRNGAIFHSPATIYNGVLYAGDDHGELFAFTPSGPNHSK